jgi:hypothetical protein
MVRLHSNGLLYAITAGHTFTDPCNCGFTIPDENLALGANGTDWTPVARSAFFPPSIDTGSFVRDVVLFEIPTKWLPPAGAPLLPTKFLPELATPEDRAAAIEAEDDSGLLLVERRAPNGASGFHELPVDLAEGFPDFLADACQNGAAPMAFALTWRLRFTRATSATPDAFVTSIAGDSGAPVYIRAIDRPGFFRILGIHFLELKDSAHGGWMSYAMDAVSFFREVLHSKPGVDCDILV